MSKPTSTPRWSDVAPGTTTAEPTSGKKDSGFTINERPPARYVNWLFYWIYQWILWLSNAGNNVRAAGGGYAETAGWAHTADGFIQATATGATWVVPLDLAVGTVVTTTRFRVLPNGATSTITCRIVKYLDETTTTVATATSGAGTAAPEWLTVAASFTVASAEFYVGIFEASGVGANQRRASVVEINP